MFAFFSLDPCSGCLDSSDKIWRDGNQKLGTGEVGADAGVGGRLRLKFGQSR